MQHAEKTPGIAAEAREETYVEAARRGEHRWWRYLLGLVVILFAWLVVGSAASLLVAFALGGQEGIAAFTNALLRYGPFIGVVGSTLIFALAHGINEVFPAALVTGLIAGRGVPPQRIGLARRRRPRRRQPAHRPGTGARRRGLTSSEKQLIDQTRRNRRKETVA